MLYSPKAVIKLGRTSRNSYNQSNNEGVILWSDMRWNLRRLYKDKSQVGCRESSIILPRAKQLPKTLSQLKKIFSKSSEINYLGSVGPLIVTMMALWWVYDIDDDIFC